jgi:hypothetical protein
MLDVTRKLAGRRYRRLRLLTDTASTPPAAVVVQAPPPKRSDRREAADAMAQAGARRV